MPTLTEVTTALSSYAGANQSFLSRLNIVRSRLIPHVNCPGTKQLIKLPVFSDADGNSIVTLPREYKTILAGAVKSDQVLCSGRPMRVSNEWAQFDPSGSGYGALTDSFQDVTGRFCVFQEWDTPMRLRFKFEVSESSGVIHIRGLYSGEKVYSLYSATWIDGEKVAFTGTTTVTSAKYFDAQQLSIVKPVTLGRVSMYAVDSTGNETLVAVYEPGETSPRWRRYMVPECDDTSVTTSTTAVVPSQVYTKTEIDALFADAGTITVSATGTHDLVYSSYISRVLKVVASAGSGAYTHKFLLDNATVKSGGTLRVRLAVAASANPTLEFYDNVSTGSPIVTVPGDSDNTTSYTLVFSFDGTNWNYEGRES